MGLFYYRETLQILASIMRTEKRTRFGQSGSTSTANDNEYSPPVDLPSHVPVFRGEWDSEGVYVYQAYKDEIADWALEHQAFGGPAWKPTRMTWIKPSFAWMLYRSGYGYKPGQTRVLKIKLSHATIAFLLSQCKCTDTNSRVRNDKGRVGQGSDDGCCRPR